MVNLYDLKREVQKIVEEGKVKYIIGYKRGTHSIMSTPLFIKKPEDVDNLIWDPTCIYNLVRFLIEEKRKKAREKNPDQRPIGIVTKGCDSRAINVLLQEKFIKREDVFIIGVSCENSGVVEKNKLKEKIGDQKAIKIEFNKNNNFLVTTENNKIEIQSKEIVADRCLECRANYPVIYDVLFGEKVKRNTNDPYKSLEKHETLSNNERWAFWKEHINKCIRCYACRSICPMCYCDECVVDTINFAVTAETTAEEKAQKIKWIEKSPVLSENSIYHLVRAIHLAGRCVDCGECERVCPENIPIRLLNKKLEKECKELFDYDAGFDPEQPSLISCFKDEDPEEFIR